MAMNDVRAIKETQKFTSNLVAGGISQETAEEIALKLDGLDGAKDGKIHITADYPQQAMMACDWLKDKALPPRMASWKWEDVRDLVTIDLQLSIKPENRPLGDKLDAWFKAEDGFLESLVALFGGIPTPASEKEIEIESAVLVAPPMLGMALPPPDVQLSHDATQIAVHLAFLAQRLESSTVQRIPEGFNQFIKSLASCMSTQGEGVCHILEFSDKYKPILEIIKEHEKRGVFTNIDFRHLLNQPLMKELLAQLKAKGVDIQLPGVNVVAAIQSPQVSPEARQHGVQVLTGTMAAPTMKPGDISANIASALRQAVPAPSVSKALPTPSEAATLDIREMSPGLRARLYPAAATEKTKVISDGSLARLWNGLKNMLPSARSVQRSLDKGSTQVNLSAQRTGVRPLVLVAGGIALAAAAIGAGIWIYTKMEDGK